MVLQLWTNPICPFAHRAAFTAKYRAPAGGVQFNWVPLSGELTKAAKEGVAALTGVNEFWAGKTVDELNEIKTIYKENLNASGEVPTVVTTDMEVVLESEICAEFLDAFGEEGEKLLPADPLAVARMRLSMKKFNDVVPTLYGLIFNQDAEQDAAKIEAIRTKMAAWVATLHSEGPFSNGSKPTLADVHAAPFLHRFQYLLSHYRAFDPLEGQARARTLLEAMEALPAFQETTLTAEKYISAYAGYAGARGVAK